MPMRWECFWLAILSDMIFPPPIETGGSGWNMGENES
jgi:hypothetical protein